MWAFHPSYSSRFEEDRLARAAAKIQKNQGKRAQVEENLMATISKLQTVAEHLVDGSFVADTRDHEDHSFSGIMFDIECQELLPIQFIEIQSIAVRGDLGEVSVYVTPNDDLRVLSKIHPREWEERFGPKELDASPSEYVELPLKIPIRLAPGHCTGIYIHSQLPGDTAIVYDDYRGTGYSFEDAFMRIHPGIAHTSNIPFARTNHWGSNAWRMNREFVGRIRYGIKYFLWTPIVHERFPATFREAVHTVMCCHSVLGKQKGSNLGKIPHDVLFRILNLLPHSWFGGEDEVLRHLLSNEEEVDEDMLEEEDDYGAGDDDDDEEDEEFELDDDDDDDEEED